MFQLIDAGTLESTSRGWCAYSPPRITCFWLAEDAFEATSQPRIDGSTASDTMQESIIGPLPS
jgi:hypothetical protein